MMVLLVYPACPGMEDSGENNLKKLALFFKPRNLVVKVVNTSHVSCRTMVDYCSPWSYCGAEGRCLCFQNTNQVFVCNERGIRTAISYFQCLTYNQDRNTTEVGKCIFTSFTKKEELITNYISLPTDTRDLNEKICGTFNRTGTLCSQCVSYSYPRVYSYNLSCTSCASIWSNVLKYVTVAFGPLTFFYFTLLLLQINIPSSRLHGFIFYSQLIATPTVLRIVFIFLEDAESYPFKIAQVFSSLYGMWNLDFLRTLNLNICLRVSPLTVSCLDFFIALYPLLLIALTCGVSYLHDLGFYPVLFLLKPVKALFRLYRSNWDVKTSIVGVFCSFLLLSTTKFLTTSIDLLLPVTVCDTSRNGTCRWAVFQDASVFYMGTSHFPYAVFGLIIFLVFVLLPILILLLYPCKMFHKVLSFLPQRWRIIFHMFLDSYQGCYKDGSQANTIDFRWFSAVPFIIRLILIPTLASYSISSDLIICVIMIVLLTICIIITDPYKVKYRHLSADLVVFMLLMATIIILVCELSVFDVQLILLVIGLVLFCQLAFITALTISWINTRRKFKFNFVTSS